MLARGAALRQPRTLTRLLYRLRTEADGPGRQAAAIGLGTLIGCTPFYGFHLLLALGLASAFRLNRLKVYLAANISNPLVAPFLIAAELQVGGWIARGSWYSPTSLSRAAMWGVAEDLLLGSAVVGGVLAVVTAGLTYGVVRRRSLQPALAQLVDRAAGRYLPTGCASWELANGKLRGDPVYLEILKRGALPQSGTLVDCGCGRGLMLALLAEARHVREPSWPADWPAPPADLRLVGIETRPRMVKMARRALGDDASVLDADLRTGGLPAAEAILLFDVIHLMPRSEQDALLEDIRQSLSPGGLLVLREADAAGGWRFRLVRVFNWTTRALQGQWARRFHFRTADEWRRTLSDAGFEVEAEPMSSGTPFANVVFYARRRAAREVQPPPPPPDAWSSAPVDSRL
jgi:uncharacterized protein (DUF2062 family)/trans-aconitate methyltransferase